MTPGTRACVAYTAGRVVSGAGGSSLYDHARSTQVTVGGTVNGQRIGLYDYDRRCNFFGTLPVLHDEGAVSNIRLEFNGCDFSGLDCESGHGFSGAVNGLQVVLHDDAEPGTFMYTLAQLVPAGGQSQRPGG